MTASFDEMARQNFVNSFRQNVDLTNMKVRECEVKPLEKDIAREYIAMFHYSKTFPDSTLYCYGAFYRGYLIGVVTYGMGCGKNQYLAVLPNIENGQYVELTRLWCSDLAKNNIESYLVGKSLKMLPKEIKLVISFSDESYSHCGIIYQATNFYYLGKNGGGKMLLQNDGIKKHPRLLGIYKMRHPELKNISNEELLKMLGYKWCEGGAKYRYVYLRGSKSERKKMFKQIESRIEPYPKTDVKKPDMAELQDIENEINKQGYKQLNLFDFD